VKRTPFKKTRTAKQACFDQELEIVTPELYDRAQGFCEAMIPGTCRGIWNLHRHHRRRRNVSKDGKANSLSNLLLCCGPCHALIHSQRAWSKQFGFIISANADPDLVHVNRTGI
jgi:hypothetical protein